MAPLLHTDDYRRAAQRRRPQGLDVVHLGPGIPTGIAEPDLSTQLFGKRRATPLVIAPTALAGMVADTGRFFDAPHLRRYSGPRRL